MSVRADLLNIFEQGKGIFRLAPNWVPRSFCIPGRRLKLHPDDLFALGGERGGIGERWLSSVTAADNGSLTAANEGLSFIVIDRGSDAGLILLREAVAELKADLVGESIWQRFGRWPVLCKLFDYQTAIPFHIHHGQRYAGLVGMNEKPESYYYPVQLNNHPGNFPFTFFGLLPGVGRQEVRKALERFSDGDNRITDLARCYKLELGSGWNVPAGMLHAPGSLCTYEPQADSDVFAMVQSMVESIRFSEELLWKNSPEDKFGDFDFLLEVIDWRLNMDADFYGKNFMRPIPLLEPGETETRGYQERWISYRSTAFSAKELTIQPGRSVTIHDRGAYGVIVIQGRGRLGVWRVESPTLIRYGQLTDDEFFVSARAAAQGVRIENESEVEPLVILKHFGPDNPDLREPLPAS